MVFVNLVSVSGDTGLSHGDMKLANSGFSLLSWNMSAR